MNVGDRVLTLLTSNGERVAIPLSTPAVGDKVLMMRTSNGERVAVPLGQPSVGDKVVAHRLQTGEFVCLFPSGGGSGGGSSVTVMPPGNFSAMRTGPSTADLDWLLGEGNDAVRIVRRTDRYPTSITDGEVIYEGAGSSTEDTGLDFRQSYYYSAWGRNGSKYSNGYLTDWIPKWGEIKADFVVEFYLTINSFASNYASHPVSRGDLSDCSDWVWIFYLYGPTSGVGTGRLGVYYGGSDWMTAGAASGLSSALSLDTTYRVRWEYTEGTGGKLYIDGVLIGGTVGGATLPTSRSSALHYGENIFDNANYPGEESSLHSNFDGSVEVIRIVQTR